MLKRLVSKYDQQLHAQLLSHVQLCDPMGCGIPGFSVHGVFQSRILEWVAMPSFRGSAQPRDRTYTSYVSWIGRQVLVPRGKPSVSVVLTNIWLLTFKCTGKDICIMCIHELFWFVKTRVCDKFLSFSVKYELLWLNYNMEIETILRATVTRSRTMYAKVMNGISSCLLMGKG